MENIKTLTPFQESQIIPHRDKWVNYILSCKNSIDKAKAKKGIEWLYKYCKKEPPIIIFMDSPYGCQVAANFFIKLLKQSLANIEANIEDNIEDNIKDNIRANIVANIWDNINVNISLNINLNISLNITTNIAEIIRDNIGNNIKDNIGDNKIKYYQTSFYGNISDYNWVAWFDYLLQMKLINIAVENDFNSFKELLLSGVYDMIQLRGLCIVSDMPVSIVRNNTGRLHNPNGYAIQFKDGYGQNYINGRYIPDEIFNKANTLTKELFLKETNSDYKGAWYEILGQQKIMEILGAIEVDKKVIAHKNGDLETVTLLKTTDVFEEIDNQSFAWVKMVCPSTGTQYLQGVEPHHTSALEAIASLSPFLANEYSFDFRS